MKLTGKLFLSFLLSLSLAIVGYSQTEKKDANAKEEKTSAAADSKDEKVIEQIGEDVLSLENYEGACRFGFNDQNVGLDLAWRCNFHRFPDGKVRMFPRDFYKTVPKSYRNTQIILIEYSKPLEDNPKECRTELQAVKIVKGKLTKSVKMGDLAACPPFQWDEKNFVGLF